MNPHHLRATEPDITYRRAVMVQPALNMLACDWQTISLVFTLSPESPPFRIYVETMYLDETQKSFLRGAVTVGTVWYVWIHWIVLPNGNG